MYFSDLKVEDGIDETADSKIVMNETSAFIEKMKTDFVNDVWYKITNDIETWMEERYYNVKRKYFDLLIDMLVGRRRYGNDETIVNEWLAGIGYNSQELRKKIYEENKDMINKAILTDALYEVLKNKSTYNSYFKDWYFKDIHTGYPQTDVVKGFISHLLDKGGLPEYLESVIDARIVNKKKELDELSERLAEIQKQVKNLDID